MRTQKISKQRILNFLSFLFHEEGHSLSNISGYLSTLADPVHCGCNLTFDWRVVDLMNKGFLLQCPPIRPACPFWSQLKGYTILLMLQLDECVFSFSSKYYAYISFPANVGYRHVVFSAESSHKISRLILLISDLPNSCCLHPQNTAKNEQMDHILQLVTVTA